MANKIVQVKNLNEEKDIRKLVYADISLDSIPAKIYFKQRYDNSQFFCALSADNSYYQNGNDITSQDLTVKNDNYGTFRDELSDWSRTGYIQEDEHSGKLYFNNDAIPNAENLAFNEEARKKSSYKLEKNVNVIAVKRAIHNIFAWTPGERILNPQFGSNLRKYLYEGITEYNKEQIMAEINKCITEWEPRAEIQDIIDLSNVQDTEENTVKIEIIYTIPSLSPEQFSYTYEQTIG